MALSNTKVLITRAEAQAEEFAKALLQAGARPVKRSVIEILFLDSKIPSLSDFDLLILTSSNGVEALSRQSQQMPTQLRVICVGKKTAASFKRLYPKIEPIVPVSFNEDGILSILKKQIEAIKGTRLLCLQAVQAKARFLQYLNEQGAVVTVLPVYSIEKKKDLGPLDMTVDYVTFFSSRSLEAFIEGSDSARKYLQERRVAAVGPVTAARADELGVRVDIVPPEATLESMIETLKEDIESRE